MYKVVSSEWGITIEDGFESYNTARAWAIANCDDSTCWEGIWEIQYYNPSPWTMII